MKKHLLLIALLIYSFFSLATLFIWDARKINTVTGDEPHYLVMSNGIIKYGSLEQTAPYKEEFKTREIYKHGLASEDAQPSPGNTHSVLGSNGLFNVHNIGLPLLLAVPFMFGGVVGAKLFMVFLGSLVVIAVWKFSSHFSENKTHRFWATIAATISLPLIPASNQIYPDLLAGLITLTGLYWFFTVHKQRAAGTEVLLAAMIVFLPWLQIKFAATCIVLLLSISAKIYFQSNDLARLKKIIQILIIAGISFVALAAYNYYAFGKVSGPYQSGALEASATSLMVLIGLHLDQNHGFILQNPVNLIGILAIGWLYKLNRTFALAWSLAFLSLIVPNALHPNWYGGGSFSGRFQWAAALVFIIPTIYGLLVIANSKEKIFKALIASGVILQIYFFYRYAIGSAHLYNKASETLPSDYSIYYYPLHTWMPMLYNVSWAYDYWPNYSWMMLTGILLTVGFLSKEIFYRKTSFILTSVFLLLFFISVLPKNEHLGEVIFQATQLPSKTGRIVNSSRFAEQGEEQQDFINFGPYYRMNKGSYTVVISYKSIAGASEIIGWADVFNATSKKQVIEVPLYGTDNVIKDIIIEFKANHRNSAIYEFRTYWNGSSNIELRSIILRNNKLGEP